MPLIRMYEPATPKTFPSAKGSMVSVLISVIAMAQSLQNALIRSSSRSRNGVCFISDLKTEKSSIKLAGHATGVIRVIIDTVNSGRAGRREVSQRRNALGPLARARLPYNSVAWLASKLAQFGERISAGDYIMSGSFTRQFPLAQGDPGLPDLLDLQRACRQCS
jgi:2-keto-4-pentenoate hydratase